LPGKAQKGKGKTGLTFGTLGLISHLNVSGKIGGADVDGREKVTEHMNASQITGPKCLINNNSMKGGSESVVKKTIKLTDPKRGKLEKSGEKKQYAASRRHQGERIGGENKGETR